MKTTQYIRQEKAIASADTGGIRQRWIWGLRLLRDSDAFAPQSTQLKPGRADELVKASKAAGLPLSEREIQYRLRAARVYPTDSQIAQASAEFKTWSALIAAGFPAYEALEGEAPADHRTEAERDHDRARALAELVGEQGTLFPLRDFEPIETPLKDLLDYTDQQDELTGRFVRHGKKRRAYVERLVEAVGGDLNATWLEAHNLLSREEQDEHAAAIGSITDQSP